MGCGSSREEVDVDQIVDKAGPVVVTRPINPSSAADKQQQPITPRKSDLGYSPLASGQSGFSVSPSYWQGVTQSPPLTLSQAPADLLPPEEPEMPYAAPYIPGPGLPPPEYHANDSQYLGWQPGRRKALLIGCNYSRAEGYELQGCVNDANCLRHLLTSKFGFQPNNIIVLHDQQPYEEYMPTKKNMLAAMRWLVEDNQAPDSMFFSFSGLGARRTSESGAEQETLLPSDFQEEGDLTDEELNAALVLPLKPGVRLHAVVDACSSFITLGLAYPAAVRENGWGYWEAQPPKQRSGHTEESLSGMTDESEGGEAVCITGRVEHASKPDQESPLSSVPSTGATTFCFIQAVKQGQAATYNTLLRAQRYALRNGPQHFTEVPNLVSSLRFDLNRPFLL